MLADGERSSQDLAYDGGAKVVLARDRYGRVGGEKLGGEREAPETEAERVWVVLGADWIRSGKEGRAEKNDSDRTSAMSRLRPRPVLW